MIMIIIIKVDAGVDHGAKFRGDRPTELGDLVANEKNITSKTYGLPELPFRAA